MATAIADDDDEQEQGAECGKSYGDTYVADGSYAHLGDVLQNINLNGEVHLHIHNLRQTVAQPERVKDVRRTCRLSLQALRNVLNTVCARLEDGQSSSPESRCIFQLATKTVSEVDAVLAAEAQRDARPKMHTRRLRSAINTKKYTKEKLMTFCHNVEDRLRMINLLINLQRDDIATIEQGSTGRSNRNATTSAREKHDANIIKLKLVLALPKLGLSKSDLNALLARFSNEVMALWTATSAVLMICCYKLALYLPQLLPICLMLTRLPKLLALGETFTFYDASNVRAELSIADFSHWDIFRTRLECKFRGTPGESTVLRGNYILTGSHLNDLILDAANWQESIREGITIYMAANILRKQEDADRCPKCQTELKLKTKFHAAGTACDNCGLSSLQLMIADSSSAPEGMTKAELPDMSDMTSNAINSNLPEAFNVKRKQMTSDPLTIFSRINVNIARSRIPPGREEAMRNMEALGFPRGEVEKAMKAAFNNPDRAVDYLLTGIPEPGTEDAPRARSPLFSTPANGGFTPTELAGQTSLDFLRNNAQFQQLKRVVQQQPQMLEPILQQLAAGNPQLAQLISNNAEEFLNILAEDDDDQTTDGQQQAISVTQEERDAIERLCRLGFDRDLAIQAYFACDKNEELATHFLFDQPEGDGAEQEDVPYQSPNTSDNISNVAPLTAYGPPFGPTQRSFYPADQWALAPIASSREIPDHPEAHPRDETRRESV